MGVAKDMHEALRILDVISQDGVFFSLFNLTVLFDSSYLQLVVSQHQATGQHGEHRKYFVRLGRLF
jgi:hypothetical protein